MEHTVRLDDLIEAIKSRHPDGDPLGELSDAVTLGEHLGEVADHLIGHFVDKARGSRSDDLRAYTRYSPRDRVVIVNSQEEARRLGHGLIEPGHLVLGLLHEPEALAAKAMVALGAPLAEVRQAAESALGPGGDTAP